MQKKYSIGVVNSIYYNTFCIHLKYPHLSKKVDFLIAHQWYVFTTFDIQIKILPARKSREKFNTHRARFIIKKIASPMGRTSVLFSPLVVVFPLPFHQQSRGGLASGSFFCTVAETPPTEIQQHSGAARCGPQWKTFTYSSSMHRHQSFDSQGEPIEYCCEW